METTKKNTNKLQINAQNLLSAILNNKGKKRMFCNDVWKDPIEESYFTFKKPSTCGGCYSALSFLSAFEPNWWQAPYVHRGFDREYQVMLGELMAYAEGGEEGFTQHARNKQLKEAEKKILTELKRRAEQAEEAAEKIRKVCPAGVTPSSGLIRHLSKSPYANGLFVKSPDIAGWVEDASFNTGAGMSYSDVLHVYVNGGLVTKSFKWRDGRSESYDNPGNKINEVLEIEVGDTEITVTVKNSYGEREITLSLPEPVAETDDAPELLPEEQVAFIADVQVQVAKTLEDKQEMRELKPQYLESRVPGIGYTSYSQPVMLWLEIDEKLGWAAYAFEEQIDARVSNRQMRFEVYVMRHGSNAKRVYESSAYESDGLDDVKFENVNGNTITLRTEHGIITKTF